MSITLPLKYCQSDWDTTSPLAAIIKAGNAILEVAETYPTDTLKYLPTLIRLWRRKHTSGLPQPTRLSPYYIRMLAKIRNEYNRMMLLAVIVDICNDTTLVGSQIAALSNNYHLTIDDVIIHNEVGHCLTVNSLDAEANVWCEDYRIKYIILHKLKGQSIREFEFILDAVLRLGNIT